MTRENDRLTEELAAIEELVIQERNNRPTGIFSIGDEAQILRARIDDRIQKIKTAPTVDWDDVTRGLICDLVLLRILEG